MENTVRNRRSFQFGLPGWRIFQHIKRGISVNWASSAAAESTLTPEPEPEPVANIDSKELELIQNQHHNNSKLVPEPEPVPGTDATECGELNSEPKIIPPVPVVTDSALLKQHKIDQCIQIKLDRNQVSNLLKIKMKSQPKKQSRKCTKSTTIIKVSQVESGRPTFKCSYLKCVHGSFLHESALNDHLAIVHGEYPFKCDVCTEHKGYRSNRNLKRHALKIHSPVELRKFLRLCPFPQCKSTYYKFNAVNHKTHITKQKIHHYPKKPEPNLQKPKSNPTPSSIKQNSSKATATAVLSRKQNFVKPNYLKKYDFKSLQTQPSLNPNPNPKPMQLQCKARQDGLKKSLIKCFFPGCNFTGNQSTVWYHNIKCHVQDKRYHCHLCPHKTKIKHSLQLHLKHRHGKIVEAAEIPNVTYSFTAKSYAEQISEWKLLQRYNITQNVQVKLDKIGNKKISSTFFKSGKRSRISAASKSKNTNKSTTSNSKSMQPFQIRKLLNKKKAAQQNSPCENNNNKNITRRGRGMLPKSAQNKTIVYKGGFKNNLNRHKNPYGNQFVTRRRPGRPPKAKPNGTVVKNRLIQNVYDRSEENMNLIQISNLNFANCDLFKIQSLQLPSSSCIDIDVGNNSNISNTSQPSQNNIRRNFQMELPKQKIMQEQESHGNLNSSLLTSHNQNQNQQHLSRALQNCNGMFFQNLPGWQTGQQIRQRKRNLKLLKESPPTTATTSLNLKVAQNDLKDSGICTFKDFTSDSISSSGIENQKYSTSTTIQGLQNLENFDAYEIVARRIDPDGSVTYQVVWREPVQNWTEELILGQPEPQKHLMDFDFHFDGEIEFGIGVKNNFS